MIKKSILTVFMLTIILTSCESEILNKSVTQSSNLPTSAAKIDIMDPNDKSSWNTIDGVETNYVKLNDINAENVNEVKLDINIDYDNNSVTRTKDGYIAGYIQYSSTDMKSGYKTGSPVIAKFGSSGKLIWKKTFKYRIASGKLTNILSLEDGSIVFSDGKSFIAKCDKDGNMLWEKTFIDNPVEMFRELFISKDNDILAAGQWKYSNGVQQSELGSDDIVITKLDQNGNILSQKGFGGSDFDMLTSVIYDKELGIVINGRTQSKDGVFAIDNGSNCQDFIACIGEDLGLKWLVRAKNNENLYSEEMVSKDGFLYVMGRILPEKEGTNLIFIMKIDKLGKRIWEKTLLGSGFGINSLAVLKNGDIIAGAGYMNKGEIVILDSNGSLKSRFINLSFSPSSITALNDGGYIITSIRQIKTIPQPAVISSIWYDTELLTVRFTGSNSIMWRKTYDRYKDSLKFDFAVPFDDGRIITGN